MTRTAPTIRREANTAFWTSCFLTAVLAAYELAVHLGIAGWLFPSSQAVPEEVVVSMVTAPAALMLLLAMILRNRWRGPSGIMGVLVFIFACGVFALPCIR